MIPVLHTRNMMPSLFNRFFNDENFLDSFNEDVKSIPAVNVKESNEFFQIEVAAPGLEKSDFHIDLDNDVLTISSEKEIKNEEKDDKEKFVRCEFNYTSFKRSFVLPEFADSEKIKANHKNGILKIEIPKKEEAKVKPKRVIDIK